MDPKQLTPAQALLFIVITIGYLVVFFTIQFKLARRSRRKHEQFRADAIRDGRQVVAHLQSSKLVQKEDHSHGNDQEDRYRTRYGYTAPDGTQHTMGRRFYWSSKPPDEFFIYLYPNSTTRYYTEGELNVGKHSRRNGLLSLLFGFILYAMIIQLVF